MATIQKDAEKRFLKWLADDLYFDPYFIAVLEKSVGVPEGVGSALGQHTPFDT